MRNNVPGNHLVSLTGSLHSTSDAIRVHQLFYLQLLGCECETLHWHNLARLQRHALHHLYDTRCSLPPGVWCPRHCQSSQQAAALLLPHARACVSSCLQARCFHACIPRHAYMPSSCLLTPEHHALTVVSPSWFLDPKVPPSFPGPLFPLLLCAPVVSHWRPPHDARHCARAPP